LKSESGIELGALADSEEPCLLETITSAPEFALVNSRLNAE